MLSKNHTCVWNLPLNKTSSKWLEKSTHVWEKPLSISILMKWEKPNMCGFYQTLTKYKGVWKKTHMFENNQTCVSFSKQVVLLFVFALVFEFLIFDIVYCIYIYLFRGAHAISGVKNTFKTAFKKFTCLGISTHVLKKTTHIKNKNSKNNIKTNKFCMWSPPRLKDFL